MAAYHSLEQPLPKLNSGTSKKKLECPSEDEIESLDVRLHSISGHPWTPK
jgi:hypothetical protein